MKPETKHDAAAPRLLLTLALALLSLAGANRQACAQTPTPTPLWVQSGTTTNINNTNAGNVGIGTAVPALKLDLRGAAETTYTNNPGLLNIITTNTQAASMGGGIRFGGVYTGTAPTIFAYIGGVKENSTDGNSAGRLVFGTRANGAAANEMTRMIIDSAGNVGIGTNAPAAKLDVNGNISASGNITATGSINAKYQDVAEWVEARERLPAGTVVVLDSAATNRVTASTQPYDVKVAGVISEAPGIVLGEEGAGKVKVATTGRVRVKVDATRAPIRVGDLLVTSDAVGVAMKSEPVDLGGAKMHRPGTIIGKALEPLASGTGEILVLLSLQ